MVSIIMTARIGQGLWDGTQVLVDALNRTGNCQVICSTYRDDNDRAHGISEVLIRKDPVAEVSEEGNNSALIGHWDGASQNKEKLKADFAVYLDDDALGTDWAETLSDNGIILVNSGASFDGDHIVAIDGDAIAKDALGYPIPWVPMLGALSLFLDDLDLDALKDSLSNLLSSEVQAMNLEALDEAYHQALSSLLTEAIDTGIEIMEQQRSPLGASHHHHNLNPRIIEP